MANNIKGNAPNAIVAKDTVSFTTAGINSTNTEIIYLVDSDLKSFKPGRAINGISGFENGKGYYMVAKVDMDLTAVVVPPLSGGGGGSYDTDAQTYFDAVVAAGGSLSGGQMTAYDSFVTGLKSNSLYTKVLFLYPLLGGTAASHAINAKTPGTKNITWNGTLSHGLNGTAGNGTSGYGNSGIIPNTDLTQDNVHAACYTRLNTAVNEMFFGVEDDVSDGNPALRFGFYSTSLFVQLNDGPPSSTTSFNRAAHFTMNRESSTTSKLFRNATLIETFTNNSSSRPTNAIYLCAENGAGTAQLFTANEFGLFSFGQAFTDAETITFNTLVSTLMNALGR